MITRFTKVLTNATTVLLAWLALVLSFSAVPGFTQRVDVYFPPDHLLRSLPEDVSIVAISDSRITLASPRRDFALSLYRQGARFLVTSDTKGCIDLSSLKPKAEIDGT